MRSSRVFLSLIFTLLVTVSLATVSAVAQPHSEGALPAPWLRLHWDHALKGAQAEQAHVLKLEGFMRTWNDWLELGQQSELKQLHGEIEGRTSCQLFLEANLIKSPQDRDYVWFGWGTRLALKGLLKEKVQPIRRERTVQEQKFYHLSPGDSLAPSIDQVKTQMLRLLQEAIEDPGLSCISETQTESESATPPEQSAFGKTRQGSVGYILDISNSVNEMIPNRDDRAGEKTTFFDVGVEQLRRALSELKPWQRFSIALACQGSYRSYQEGKLLTATAEEIQNAGHWLNSLNRNVLSHYDCREFLNEPFKVWAERNQMPERVVIHTDGYIKTTWNLSGNDAEVPVLEETLTVLRQYPKTKVDILPLANNDYLELVKRNFRLENSTISGDPKDWETQNMRTLLRNHLFVPTVTRHTGGTVLPPMGR